mmetsp:Transcript_2102/g.3845  ORF Transcript_2102/g.3845 Transcript_2102/m.3845 type:complete len:104 (+) Transcript_2102:2384-2695(+)
MFTSHGFSKLTTPLISSSYVVMILTFLAACSVITTCSCSLSLAFSHFLHHDFFHHDHQSTGTIPSTDTMTDLVGDTIIVDGVPSNLRGAGTVATTDILSIRTG